ncbi:sulfotransferase family protein [Salegentibacter flavus]|uniref:Sulfotransferase family protein n=1 Tax=Salegentibacter flavus TaxID=287099 RepID=A0A1I4Y4R1_9FLAO|nr:sulfotransferase [Salegentibacter flavus]SFN33064.1 Sulfotransferase family protein [Salegentibacter flavus]
MKKFFYWKYKEYEVTFIFGSARGGTTWLWSLLESHSEVKPFVNESNNLEQLFYITSESGIYVKDPKNAKRIIESFLKKNRNYKVIEKTPSHTLLWRDILNDFPNSRNIIILRNPLAIVNSMVRSEMTAFEDYGLEKSIDSVKAYFKCLMELIKLDKYYIVSYENLLLNTASELVSILDYLNLSKDFVEDIIASNKNTSKVSVNGVFRKGKAESYRIEFTEKELLYLEEKLRNELTFFKLMKK